MKSNTIFKVWVRIVSIVLVFILLLCFFTIRFFDNKLLEDFIYTFKPFPSAKIDSGEELYKNISVNLDDLERLQNKNLTYSYLDLPMPVAREFFYGIGIDRIYADGSLYKELEDKMIIYLENVTGEKFGSDHHAWEEWLAQFTHNYDKLEKEVKSP